jgi:hypothetical protein|tara:strand:+ start:243 stop:950 length:708 start_codon:yes stop_codon:yes gene_type:complete
MKRKDYIYIGAYLLFFGWFVNTIVEEKQYQNEQFQKINKLNNDLITISNYLDNNIKDISNNNNQIDYISIQLEELKEDLKDVQNSAESFYQMFFDTQTQRVEEELVIEEDRIQDLQSTPAPSITKENEETPPQEQEVAEAPVVPEMPVEVPTVKITTASCPTPNKNLLPFVEDIYLRRDYVFTVLYDVKDSEITNVRYQGYVPNKLKRAIQSYLNSFNKKGTVSNCSVKLKLLGN